MSQGRKPFKSFRKKEKPEFEQTIADLARVTRVTKGGKQLSFRACVLIGDRKGRVGYGVQKGKDVQIAVDKAVNQAKKNLIMVPIVDGTIPHKVESKYKAAKVMVKPAPMGSGIIAGSSIRTVLELAGIPNASSKMLGRTNNKITNIKATFSALTSFSASAVIIAKENAAKKANEAKAVKETVEVKTEAPAKKVAKKAPAKKKAAPKAKAE